MLWLNCHWNVTHVTALIHFIFLKGALSSQGGLAWFLCLQSGWDGKMLCAFNQKDTKESKQSCTFSKDIQRRGKTPPTQSKKCSRTVASVVQIPPNLDIYNKPIGHKPLYQGSVSSLACYCKDLLLHTWSFCLYCLTQVIVFIRTHNWVSLL